MFSARFDKRKEFKQVINKIEMHTTLTTNGILTQSDIDIIDVRSQLVQQIENQEIKDSGWKFK